jgi:hypothetical protein
MIDIFSIGIILLKLYVKEKFWFFISGKLEKNEIFVKITFHKKIKYWIFSKIFINQNIRHKLINYFNRQINKLTVFSKAQKNCFQDFFLTTKLMLAFIYNYVRVLVKLIQEVLASILSIKIKRKQNQITGNNKTFISLTKKLALRSLWLSYFNIAYKPFVYNF